MELKFIVLLGAPGAGKGTQTEALERVLTEEGKSVCGVLYIKVSTETLMARLGGRWICRNCEGGRLPFSL